MVDNLKEVYEGDHMIQGDLTIDRDTVYEGNLHVTGKLTINANLEVKGALTILEDFILSPGASLWVDQLIQHTDTWAVQGDPIIADYGFDSDVDAWREEYYLPAKGSGMNYTHVKEGLYKVLGREYYLSFTTPPIKVSMTSPGHFRVTGVTIEEISGGNVLTLREVSPSRGVKTGFNPFPMRGKNPNEVFKK